MEMLLGGALALGALWLLAPTRCAYCRAACERVVLVGPAGERMRFDRCTRCNGRNPEVG